MDLDRLLAFFTKVGFPAGIAIWFLWKIQGFMDALTVQQATVIELLRQLVEIHK